MILGGLAVGLGVGIPEAAFGDKKEKNHPKIRNAIRDLKDARDYLEKAPHHFGGHRAKAVKLIDQTVAELEECLAY